MKKHAIILGIVLSIIVIGVIGVFSYKSFRTIPFEEIYVCDAAWDSSNDLNWFTLRDESYKGFFFIEMLETLGVDCSEMEFDYSKYTYVITVGHELNSISHSYSQMKNRKFGIIPKQFVGNVELKSEETDKVYIYRIKKMDIDCDYHDRKRAVSFV